MKKVLTSILIILLFLFQCEKRHFEKEYRNYEKFTGFPQEETWEFERLSDVTFFFPPRIKIIQDHYLFVLTTIDGKLIQIYNMDDGRLIKSFGKKGQGPGEYIGATGILYNSFEPDKFWIHDVSLMKIERYDLNVVLKKDYFKSDSTIKISTDAGIAFKLFLLGKKEFVGIGSLKSRLTYYDLNGDTIRTNRYIPGVPKKNVSARIHMQAYDGVISCEDQVKRIAISNTDCDILEIYDYSGEMLKTLHGPDIFVNDYGYADEYSLVVDTKQCGYFSICSSSREIYCSYSGQKPKSMTDWTASLGREIFVFDWDGIPLKKGKLNYQIASMDYSEERNTIYAICYDGEEFFIGYHRM